jgi:hypothetical protein
MKIVALVLIILNWILSKVDTMTGVVFYAVVAIVHLFFWIPEMGVWQGILGSVFWCLVWLARIFTWGWQCLSF